MKKLQTYNDRLNEAASSEEENLNNLLSKFRSYKEFEDTIKKRIDSYTKNTKNTNDGIEIKYISYLIKRDKITVGLIDAVQNNKPEYAVLHLSSKNFKVLDYETIKEKDFNDYLKIHSKNLLKDMKFGKPRLTNAEIEKMRNEE